MIRFDSYQQLLLLLLLWFTISMCTAFRLLHDASAPWCVLQLRMCCSICSCLLTMAMSPLLVGRTDMSQLTVWLTIGPLPPTLWVVFLQCMLRNLTRDAARYIVCRPLAPTFLLRMYNYLRLASCFPDQKCDLIIWWGGPSVFLTSAACAIMWLI